MRARYEKYSNFVGELSDKAAHDYRFESIAVPGDLRMLELCASLIIEYPWQVFLAFCALMALGVISFTAALTTLMVTPLGLALAAILGVTAIPKLKELYKSKRLPAIIKEIGDKYRNEYKHIQSSYSGIAMEKKIDELFDRAYEDTIQLMISRRH